MKYINRIASQIFLSFIFEEIVHWYFLMCQRRSYLYWRASRLMLTLYPSSSSTGQYMETACQPWVELLLSSPSFLWTGSGAQNSAFPLRFQCWRKWDPMKLVTLNACFCPLVGRDGWTPANPVFEESGWRVSGEDAETQTGKGMVNLGSRWRIASILSDQILILTVAPEIKSHFSDL